MPRWPSSLPTASERSADLKRRILAHVDGLVQESKELAVQVDSNATMSFEAKEALYEQIDALEKDIDNGLEEVLEAVMPEGFALLKETARRFVAEGDVQVTASEMDRILRPRGILCASKGNKPLLAREWNAAGSKVEWNMVHYDVQLIGGVAPPGQGGGDADG